MRLLEDVECNCGRSFVFLSGIAVLAQAANMPRKSSAPRPPSHVPRLRGSMLPGHPWLAGAGQAAAIVQAAVTGRAPDTSSVRAHTLPVGLCKFQRTSSLVSQALSEVTLAGTGEQGASMSHVSSGYHHAWLSTRTGAC